MHLHPYSYEQLMGGTMLVQAACIVGYFISSLVVSGNAFDGFNAVMLGIVYGGTLALTYLKIRKNPSRLMYGIILGMSVILLVISLQSAIFWGQYAGCSSSSSSTVTTTTSPTMSPSLAPASAFTTAHRKLYITEQCKNRFAMRSISAFSVFIFLSYIFKLAVLVRYKNDILQQASADQEGYSAVTNPAYAQPTISSIPTSYGRAGSR